jgi:putative monooxygenase ydhR
MAVILQINFVNEADEAAVAGMNLSAAPHIAELLGLRWKIFIRDSRTQDGGGIYLFDTREQAEAWLAGPGVAAVRQAPTVHSFSAKIFDVQEEPSRITRAPLEAPTLATS